MNKPKSLPSQQIEESLERFRKFQKDIDSEQPYTSYHQLEAFLKQELERVAESSYQEGFEQGFESCRKDIREGKHVYCCFAKDLEKVKESARKEAAIKSSEVIKKLKLNPHEMGNSGVHAFPYNMALDEVERGIHEVLGQIPQSNNTHPKLRTALAQSKDCSCECHILGENYPCSNPNCSQSKGERR